MKKIKCTVTAICRDNSQHKIEVPELYAGGIRISDIGNLRNVDHVVIQINHPSFQLRPTTLSKLALLDVPLKILTYNDNK